MVKEGVYHIPKSHGNRILFVPFCDLWHSRCELKCGGFSMCKMSHRSLIALAGAIWFIVGCCLLQLGLSLLIQAAQRQQQMALLRAGSVFGGEEAAAVVLIAIALFVGHLKGRYLLRRAARRAIDRIRNLPNPSSIISLYAPRYYFLVAVMIGLGITMRLLGVSADLRGVIDVAVGAALINGALAYFQEVIA